MVMSLSSAAFFAENFAGTVSVFAGAPGTAKAPLTNAAFAGGLAFGGGRCWAAARPTLPTNASASALVRTRSHRMAVSFSSARDGVIPPTHQQTVFLFDHLVGACEHGRGNFEAERPGGRQIDEELERDRAHNRQIDGFGPLENAPGISAELPEHLGEAGSVAH